MRAGGTPDRGVRRRAPAIGERPRLPGRAARGRRARPAGRLARRLGSRGRGRRRAARPARPRQGGPGGGGMTLSGQRVVVVGGTSGMGLATVARRGRAGRRGDRRRAPAGRRPRADRRASAQAHVDVTDEASVRALFDGIGAVDHLFVSASPGSPGAVPRAGPGRRAHLPRRQAPRRLGVRPLRRAAACRAGGSITFVTGVAAVRPAAPRGDGHGRVRRRRGACRERWRSSSGRCA